MRVNQKVNIKVSKKKSTKSYKNTSIAKLQKQITTIAKRDAPEIKYVDIRFTNGAVGATSLAGLGQGYSIHGMFGQCFQGTSSSTRLGNKTKLQSLELRGEIATASSNTSNGYVDIYCLRYNKNTMATIFGNVIGGQEFLENDGVLNSISSYSFRNREFMKDFTVMQKKRFYLNADSYNTQRVLKQLYMKINLKGEPMIWDANSSTSVTSRGIYILMVASAGDTTSGTAYGYDMRTRCTFTDA